MMLQLHGRLRHFIQASNHSVLSPGKVDAAYAGLVVGNVVPFVTFLEDLLKEQPARAIKDWNEAVFRSVIVVSFYDATPSPACRPELCLVVDPTAIHGSGRHGFLDIIFPGTRFVPCIELKYFTLEDLFRGQLVNKDLDKERRSDVPLEDFRKKLQAETEQELLKRKARYQDRRTNQWHDVHVEDTLQQATQQIKMYLSTIEKGDATDSSAGVHDSRLRCEEGSAQLLGYVIICLGGTRVLAYKVDSKETKYCYVATS
jgi:hypothetical protein